MDVIGNGWTDDKIKIIIEKYKREKEYRRVYYNHKYKNDMKYRTYVRDYNKRRYEDSRLLINYDKGIIDLDTLKKQRAYNLYKYYEKDSRLEQFMLIYKNEYDNYIV